MSTNGPLRSGPRIPRFGAVLLPLALCLVACTEEVDPWRLDENGNPRGERLFDLGEIPAFELVDHEERPFTRESLRGRLWVVNFVFTHCPSICPRVTAEMRRCAGRYKDEDRVGFLTFTVDPERDTPEVLNRYAANYEADPERWYFLTGPDRDVLYGLIEESFLQPIGEPADGDIPHSDRFVVLDFDGHIRAAPSMSMEAAVGDVFLEEVSHALDLLLDGKGGPLDTERQEASTPGEAPREGAPGEGSGGP